MSAAISELAIVPISAFGTSDMLRAMGLFFRRLRLEPGEVVRSDLPANQYRGARSVGGRLALTDRAVIFEPNWLDFATFARGRRIAVSDIVKAEIVPAERSASPHEARARVRIEVSDGDPLLVAVADPDALVQALS